MSSSLVAIFCLIFSVQCLALKELHPTPDGVNIFQKMVKHETHTRPFPTPKGEFVYSIVGHTATIDPGSQQRIIDVVGWVSQNTGELIKPVIVSSVIEGEVTADGIASYDWKTQQAYFASDGAFGGTVFFAEMSNSTVIPPQSYYLSPVVWLGYDPVSGARLIAGKNTPSKNFLIMDKPNWGQVTLFQLPSTLTLSPSDVFNGKTMDYHTVGCTQLGTCTFSTWNLKSNSVTLTFPLSCLPSNGYIVGRLWITAQGSVQALVFAGTYSVYSIDPSAKSCKQFVSVLPGLPQPPLIIISQDYGYLTGNFYISVTANGFAGINVYDSQFKLQKQIMTQALYEDIFVQES